MSVPFSFSADPHSVWLVYWEGNKFHRSLSFYQGIYALLGILAAIFTGLTGVTLALMAIKASKTLFSQGLQHVFFSPMKFFDTTPLGRIQGVFSTDVNAIDNMVPESLRYTLIIVASVRRTRVLCELTSARWFDHHDFHSLPLLRGNVRIGQVVLR